MQKIKVIVNLEYKEGEVPGGFLKTEIEIPENIEVVERDLLIQKAFAKRLRWTIE